MPRCVINECAAVSYGNVCPTVTNILIVICNIKYYDSTIVDDDADGFLEAQPQRSSAQSRPEAGQSEHQDFTIQIEGVTNAEAGR
jgi:hypothetical protein